MSACGSNIEKYTVNKLNKLLQCKDIPVATIQTEKIAHYEQARSLVGFFVCLFLFILKKII